MAIFNSNILTLILILIVIWSSFVNRKFTYFSIFNVSFQKSKASGAPGTPRTPRTPRTPLLARRPGITASPSPSPASAPIDSIKPVVPSKWILKEVGEYITATDPDTKVTFVHYETKTLNNGERESSWLIDRNRFPNSLDVVVTGFKPNGESYTWAELAHTVWRDPYLQAAIHTSPPFSSVINALPNGVELDLTKRTDVKIIVPISNDYTIPNPNRLRQERQERSLDCPTVLKTEQPISEVSSGNSGSSGAAGFIEHVSTVLHSNT